MHIILAYAQICMGIESGGTLQFKIPQQFHYQLGVHTSRDMPTPLWAGTQPAHTLKYFFITLL